ncbi:hypothetical protein E8E14_004346 [Neopestalotiopsis sp. 37M]|nr:hypothetical protein E8E14_004346 [Neopestalotiopsis sp. 37M]
MNLISNLAKKARELAGTGSTEASKLCQESQPDMISDTDVAVYALRTQSVESLVIVGINDKDKEVMRSAGTASAAVCPFTSISNTDSSGAHDNIEPDLEEEPEEELEDDPREELEEESEEELENIFIQQAIIKAFDGQEHSIEAEIDTGNRAKFMLISRRLVKELELKEEPLLAPSFIRGINGPRVKSVSFARISFRMPELELGWVTANVHVVDCNVGFNLGGRAIRKFKLLSKLVELEEKAGERLPMLRGRHISSAPASTVHTVIDVRSKAKKKKEEKKHQENSHLAARLASFREQWQSGADGCPSIYAPSIESSDISATATSTAVMSNASTWSTSTTYCSIESSEQKPKM